MSDRIEFYDAVSQSCIAAVESVMVPPVDSLIAIGKLKYRVTTVTYALDYTDRPNQKQMRANVWVKELP